MARKTRVESHVAPLASNILPAGDLRKIDINDPNIVAMNKALRGEPWSIEHQMGSGSITLPRPQAARTTRRGTRTR